MSITVPGAVETKPDPEAQAWLVRHEAGPFGRLLMSAGLTKRELAERLGVSAHQVSVWKQNPPLYALAYLELYVKLKEAK